jgi:RNA polymerase sigma factor (TIGR02999 family)
LTLSDTLQNEIYQELRELAARKLRGQRPGHTLQATALVHEVYLKISGSRSQEITDRAHFFAVAAMAMHQVLINYARRRGTAKRGGDWNRITLNEGITPGGTQEFDLFFLNQMLTELEELDERQARIVKLRFLGGMTVDEIAQVLELSASTVKREWRMARAWLSSQFQKGEAT